MTELFKQAMIILFHGGSITPVGGGKYRICDPARNSKATVGFNTYKKMKSHCKRKGMMWVIDKRLILSYRRNHWVKKSYIEIRDKSIMYKATQEALSLMLSFPTYIAYMCYPSSPLTIRKFNPAN